jgi:toxin ParE1/3/4
MEERYRVEYLPSAIRDLESVFDYISGELFSPQAAFHLLDKIEKSVFRLSIYPFSCEKIKDLLLNKKGYRVLVVEHYLVFYVVSNQIVEIRRVLYNKQIYRNILE